MPILITGATGTNGREIVKELAALRAPVRALVRDAARAADLRSLGAELAVGSFENPGTIEAAAKGCDRALILVPVDRNMLEYARSGISAARRAGVRHIVYFSAMGAGSGRSFLATVHRQAEQAAKESGAEWTVLRPNFFMQNLLGSTASIKGEGRIYNHFRNGKTAQVDVRDTAAVAARTLAEPIAKHQGRTYEISGPQSLSNAELAAALSRVLGRAITSVDIPREAVQQAMISAGMPEWLATAITDLDELVFSGEAGVVSDTVRRIAGRDGITFERFVRDHAGAFRA